MRWPRCFVPFIVLLAVGCGKESTPQLIEKLKAKDALTRVQAVRTLPERKDDAEQVVPALIEALQDEEGQVRKSAALGLGSFGEQAKSAIPALLKAQKDREADVRRAASIALSRIDAKFPNPSQPKSRRGK